MVLILDDRPRRRVFGFAMMCFARVEKIFQTEIAYARMFCAMCFARTTRHTKDLFLMRTQNANTTHHIISSIVALDTL
jgi:hypothetical protein